MKVLACNQEDCWLERRREAMNAMRAHFTGQTTSGKWSANDYRETCKTCGMTRGWKRDEDGTEREISQAAIWGRENAAQQ
jgi:hypothetical protein